eukprot:scaffold7284_cov115-Isochrysis_galbana.AAC.7
MGCEMDNSHLFPISRATPRCYTAVGWRRRLEPYPVMQSSLSVFFFSERARARARVACLLLGCVRTRAHARNRALLLCQGPAQYYHAAPCPLPPPAPPPWLGIAYSAGLPRGPT